MTTLLLALLTWLLNQDPLNAFWVKQVPVRVESPIIRDGKQYDAWGNWSPNYIAIDLPGIMAKGTAEHQQRIWAACLLAHEAQHVRLRTPYHERAYLYQYVCLDRLGATEGMKQALYNLMLADLPRDMEDVGE